MLETPDRPSRTRLPQDTRREQLMDAAIAVIAEDGLTNLTLNKVAERAGLTAGMVNFHFQTKRDLLDATLARQIAAMTENLEKALDSGGGSPTKTLVALADSAFEPAVFCAEKLAALQAFWGAGAANETYMTACATSVEAFEAAVCGSFDRLVETTGAGLDTRAATLGLVGLIDLMWWRIMADQVTVEDAKRNCRSYLANHFPAFAADFGVAR